MDATPVTRARVMPLPGSRRLLGVLSDERLVAAVRAGNNEAFAVLFDRHHRALLAFCRHMLASADDAEDAVQQSFVSAHRDLLRGDKEIRFKPWLYTIARNRCLSILRARHEQASDEIEVAVDRLSDDVAQRADLRALLADVAQLPDRQRAALVLAELGDLSHADIGAVLDCEASQVKALVFQARAALIDRRRGREAPCEQIREELATLRGGALRRSHLRHHLAACPGCRSFREDVREQRQMLAVALPVLPSLGLRDSVLAALGGGGGAGGAGLGAAAAAVGTKAGGAGLASGGLAKVVATVAVAGGVAAGGGAVASDLGDGDRGRQASAAGAAAPAPAPRELPVAGGGDAGRGAERSAGRKGFTPVRGESNGARAREFAATRGRGRERSAAARERRRAARRRGPVGTGPRGAERRSPRARGVAPSTPRRPAATPRRDVAAEVPTDARPVPVSPLPPERTRPARPAPAAPDATGEPLPDTGSGLE